jgi:short-subunit dehydrogenase
VTTIDNTGARYLILGASRGLGRAVFEILHREEPVSQFLLSSRRMETVSGLSRTEIFSSDFSKFPPAVEAFERFLAFSPTHLIYCAGGGPFGYFGDKKIADHQWAINVNFLFPMYLLHAFSAQTTLRRALLVGSAVAEALPDPKAASYCAAKHALRGLVTTLQAEGQLPFSVSLFSPGYLDTELLPKNSMPRTQNLVENVSSAAERLIKNLKSENYN